MSTAFKSLAAVTAIAAVFSITLCVLRTLYPKRFSEQVLKYSEEYGIDESLVYSIIKCESNFKADSVSHAGAIGLMQITPDTLEWAVMKENEQAVPSEALFDEETAIHYGCCIYSLLFNEFEDTVSALAAYNAGRGNVLKWLADGTLSHDGHTLNSIPFPETAEYVKKVQAVKRIYELIY